MSAGQRLPLVLFALRALHLQLARVTGATALQRMQRLPLVG